MRPTAAAVAFLKHWSPAGPWVVTALDPDEGYVRTRAFGPGNEMPLRNFITLWNGRGRNIYFGVNQDLRETAEVEKKSRKEHIGSVVALHVDVDAYKGALRKAEVQESFDWDLPSGIPGPASVVIDSGNGLQSFWLLDKPIRIDGDIAKAEAVERYNRGLAVAYHGDMTTDVTRIMRMPFTRNFPNEKKRSLGLGVSIASVIWMKPGRRYSLDQFPAIAGGASRPTTLRQEGRAAKLVIGDGVSVADVDELDVPERTKTIIEAGRFPREERSSRSEWVRTVTLSLLRCGEPDEVILGVLTDARFGISDSILEKPDPEAEARRQIAKAHAWLSTQLEHEFDGDD